MRVVVAGAGFTGRRLIAKLSANRHDVVAIDLNRDICEMTSSQLGVVAICGNATEVTVLEEAEVGKADVVVALMRQSADNLAFALLAKSAGVGRIMARMRNPKYREAYKRAGVDSIIDVAGLFLGQLLLEIERPQIHKVASFGGGKGAIIEVRVPRNSHLVGKTVGELYDERRYRYPCLIAGIVRASDGTVIIPRGPEPIYAGDQVLLSGETAALRDAVDYFGIKQSLASLIRSRKGEVGIEAEEIDRQAQVELDTALENQEESEGPHPGC
jgi:trk system potassium uptake protein TrkA